MRIDVHQHIWTEPLVDALCQRDELPFVRRSDGLTVLHLAGERPYVIDTEAERPDRRASLVHADGLDRALISISSPIGIEALRRRDAVSLIDAYTDGVAGLPDAFSAWAPIALDRLDPRDAERALDGDFVGVSLPAGALAGIGALDDAAALLAVLAERGAPLFVHPGPGGSSPRTDASLGEPLWWPALTDYVAQMQTAWLAFAAFGRREHPQLPVVFAMLAGGAPLLSERLAARGGPAVDLRDPMTFYDTSSYGPVAIDAIGRVVGESALVYGSDRPIGERQQQAVVYAERTAALIGAR